MACRVGISTDPDERKVYWKRVHPSLRGWKILSMHKTKTAAQVGENRVAREHGCDSAPGGPNSPLPWYVYHFYF